jgi:hypothetical protein
MENWWVSGEDGFPMASLEAIEALAQEQGITVPPEAGTAGNAQLLSSPLLLEVQFKNIYNYIYLYTVYDRHTYKYKYAYIIIHNITLYHRDND